MTDVIAVGVDGTEPSLLALRWAIAEAKLRRARLIGVIAQPSTPESPHGWPRHVHDSNRDVSDRLDHIRAAIEKAVPSVSDPGIGMVPASEAEVGIEFEVEVGIEFIEGHPIDVLIGVSKRVDLLVVGGRGVGGWKGAFAGSLSDHLAGHTSAPLAVVRSYAPHPRGRVVVGVDRSSSSEAVRFGVAEAALRGSSVLVVSTWQYPVLGTRPTSPEAAEMLEDGARALLDEAVITSRTMHPEVQLDTLTCMGHPVEVLAEQALTADMVVVGSRGGSGFKTAMLGSVPVSVLHRVASPVVVVRGAP